MKAEQIRIGAVLKLKREVFLNSCHANGEEFTDQCVRVTEIKPRPGYRVPWVRNAEGDSFRPSDFEYEVEPNFGD